MCVVIADECDGPLKKQMLATFRIKRIKRHLKPAGGELQRKWHVHDSLYFGDSVDSVGLQIADAANWTTNRLLRGADVDIAIAKQLRAAAVCSTQEPEWSVYRHVFKTLGDVASDGTS